LSDGDAASKACAVPIAAALRRSFPLVVGALALRSRIREDGGSGVVESPIRTDHRDGTWRATTGPVATAASLSTKYLGLELRSPLVVSACPLSRDVDTVRQLAEAGAGAIVLFSLFEEQLGGGRGKHGLDGEPWESLREECTSPDPVVFHSDPEAYLEHIARLKDAIDIPVIASLNVGSRGRWKEYAKYFEQAGADAIELDLYKIAADPSLDSVMVEQIYCDIVADVKRVVSIPVAAKLSPYFTALAAMVSRLDRSGVDGLVLFNRFYQPSIDIERRELVMNLDLSQSEDGRLPMMWIALLAGQVRASLAANTGIHSGPDALRMIMSGADVAMLCSALLRHGVERLAAIRSEIEHWMASHGHESLDEIRGVMSRVRQCGSADFTRAGYAKVLTRYW